MNQKHDAPPCPEGLPEGQIRLRRSGVWQRRSKCYQKPLVSDCRREQQFSRFGCSGSDPSLKAGVFVGPRHKKGQLQLSFGMIFSIIIIIVTVAVAFYVIKEFMVTSKCTEIRAFHDDLQREVDSVWRSAAAQVAYKRTVPSSVASICFGEPKSWNRKTAQKEADAFDSYRGTAQNFFVYPVQCGRSVSVRQVSHVSIPQGFCVDPIKGEVRLTLSKSSSTTAEVTLAP